jgi:hypothetical protein
MRRRIPLVLALVALVAVGCEQQPVDPTGDVAVAAAPVFDWMNNPDNGNIKVMRSSSDFVWYWFDDELPLAAIHSTLPLDDVFGGPQACGLQGPGEPVSIQDVSSLKEEELCDNDVHEVLKGEVWITIIDVSVPGTCLGSALVAEGWGKLSSTDNDFCGIGPGERGTNSYSFKGQGMLTAPDGNKVAYSGMGQHLYSNKQGFRATHRVHVN